MTVRNLLRKVDDIKPNDFSVETKIGWLNEVEGMVQTEVLLLATEEIIEYDAETDLDNELLVRSPHNKLYEPYICARIDFANGEYGKYQNSMQMFNSFWEEYVCWFARNYRPADTHGEVY